MNTETIQVYGVLEVTDRLFINFFTSRQECNRWVSEDHRLGTTIIGPWEVPQLETPFEIVLGCDSGDNIQNIYVSGEEPDDVFEKHTTVLGEYIVYESVEEFDSSD